MISIVLRVGGICKLLEKINSNHERKNTEWKLVSENLSERKGKKCMYV